MSDDRWSKDQQEIEDAARTHGPPLAVCGSQHHGYTCELGRGHVGNHRAKLASGGHNYWWNVVTSEEIDEFNKHFAPTPGPTPRAAAKPGESEPEGHFGTDDERQ